MIGRGHSIHAGRSAGLVQCRAVSVWREVALDWNPEYCMSTANFMDMLRVLQYHVISLRTISWVETMLTESENECL